MLDLKSLVQEPATSRVQSKLGGCAIGKAAAELTPADREVFIQWVNSWDGTYEGMADALRRNGLDTASADIASRHLKGRCSCRVVGAWPST